MLAISAAFLEIEGAKHYKKMATGWKRCRQNNIPTIYCPWQKSPETRFHLDPLIQEINAVAHACYTMSPRGMCVVSLTNLVP